MAGYSGRRAPNFSQYLDDLNTIPSPYDQALQQQQQQQQDTINFDEELAVFTNAEFFDFDKFANLDLPTFDGLEDKNAQVESEDQTQNPDMKFLDFLNADGLGTITDFQNDLNVHPQPVPIQNTSYQVAPQTTTSLAAPMTTHQTVAPAPAPNMSAAASAAAAAGPKRKNTQKSTQASAEEAARNIAEEDKRRRNTAASARFRVKKKMREQALEKTLKESNDKSDALEARVSQLELENHWLRGLIMEKNGNEERDEQAEKAISDMFKAFMASQKTESSPFASKLGVGTSA
ncbi:uncharacterized protein N7443_004387 [Penicillium atrosanguineum]|uniref:BZIP domain-containing protein n=1 Tax=Penicillium atrosanguineum TaxID=1132637 RepID=A0A9W9Q6J6_9EURO|nr:uncharacterized protein N7443_004387 [Penicillium atrosanguineum]KAJ5133989.1 hypothetical protein N7526_005354 [Penicillium atrosanguineum]KAJ5304727.1 hypothetical protein N7443_004387 [Penicillium atrosanguineum]KAJ5324192.1 hypothetical protein N7476_002792 [Penicillium atrosanguineum]